MFKCLQKRKYLKTDPVEVNGQSELKLIIVNPSRLNVLSYIFYNPYNKEVIANCRLRHRSRETCVRLASLPWALGRGSEAASPSWCQSPLFLLGARVWQTPL